MIRVLKRSLRARLLLSMVVATSAALLVLSFGPSGPPPGSAADPFVAGQRSTVRSPLGGEAATGLRASAAANRQAIGVVGVARSTVERVQNRFDGVTYDEVTDLDARGRALALQRFDQAGQLVGAVRFGGHNPRQRSVTDASAAASAADRQARALGLRPEGVPRVRPGAPSEWVAEWPRVVDGVPVPGDGVVVRTWADGTLHTAVGGERPLAQRPERLLSATEARSRASARLATWLPGRPGANWQIARVALAWIAPNDAFEPAGPDAPGAVLRLAWVVEVTTGGDLAESIRGLELYLDAGDGRLLGGDVLR